VFHKLFVHVFVVPRKTFMLSELNNFVRDHNNIEIFFSSYVIFFPLGLRTTVFNIDIIIRNVCQALNQQVRNDFWGIMWHWLKTWVMMLKIIHK